MLNGEQMEEIVGGTYQDTAVDSQFLNSLAGLCDRWGSTRLFWDSAGDYWDKVDAAWAKCGIEAHTHWYSANEYYYNGKKISWQEARKIAAEKFVRKVEDVH